MTEKILNHYRPAAVSPPGSTIADLLEEHGIRQTELATRMGVTPKFVNELIAGKASLTPETALGLERALGTPAGFWLAREAHFQEAQARAEEAPALETLVPWLSKLPYREMMEFGWIPKTTDKVEIVSNCLSYFGVASATAWQEQYIDKTARAAYRMSAKAVSNEGAVAAWLRAGERAGAQIDCAPFDRESFLDAVQWARTLTIVHEPADFLPQLVARFAACGVAVVVARSPRHCPISGAVRWQTPTRALVQLSFKYLRNDSFWFSFFHECGHIALHGKKMLYLESDKMEGDDEKQADRFAADKLIPPTDWQSFNPLRITAAHIVDFSAKVGVAPGIVLGRLQNEGRVPWSRFNHLKVHYQWTTKD